MMVAGQQQHQQQQGALAWGAVVALGAICAAAVACLARLHGQLCCRPLRDGRTRGGIARATRRLWRGSQARALVLIALVGGLRATGTAHERLGARSLLVPGPRRLEPLVDGLLLALAGLCLLQLLRARASLGERRGTGERALGVAMSSGSALLGLAIAATPRTAWVSDALLCYTRALFAAAGLTLTALLMGAHFRVRSAALAVPVHNVVVAAMLRRVLGVTLGVTVALLAFTATQAWLALAGHPTLEGQPVPLLHPLLQLLAHFSLCCAMLVHNSKPPVARAAQSGQASTRQRQLRESLLLEAAGTDDHGNCS